MTDAPMSCEGVRMRDRELALKRGQGRVTRGDDACGHEPVVAVIAGVVRRDARAVLALVMAERFGLRLCRPLAGTMRESG